MEVSGQLISPATLPPEKRPPYILDRRLAEPQRQSGRCGAEKNVALSKIEENVLRFL
jgi:hypothetical protein